MKRPIIIRYTTWHNGKQIIGIGRSCLEARNNAMQKIRALSPDDPRVQYLSRVIEGIEAK